MATYSSNKTIAWAGPLQATQGSPLTFTVPANTFFKGHVGVNWTIGAISPESALGVRVKLNNVSGAAIHANSRAISGYQGANFSGSGQFGFSSELTLGAGTYYLEDIQSAANPGNPNLSATPTRYFIAGQLYENTPA